MVSSDANGPEGTYQEHGTGQLTPGSVNAEIRGESHSIDAREVLPSDWFTRFEFGIVRSGVIIRQCVATDETTTAIDAVGPGGLIPLRILAADAEHSAAGALGLHSRGRGCFAATDSVITLFSSPSFENRELVRLCASTIARMERIADARNRSSIAARVATLLCVLSDELTEEKSGRVPDLYQRDIAALINARHESVSRVLSQFQRKGWVERVERVLRISQRAELESVE